MLQLFQTPRRTGSEDLSLEGWKQGAAVYITGGSVSYQLLCFWEVPPISVVLGHLIGLSKNAPEQRALRCNPGLRVHPHCQHAAD